MKVMGKFAALAGAALLLGTSVAFADEVTGADYNLPEGMTFSYTLSSDLVKAHNISSDDRARDCYEWNSEFGGFVNKFAVGYNSDLLGFSFAPKVKIGEPNSENFWSWGNNGSSAAGKWGTANYGNNWVTNFDRDGLNSDDTGIFYDGLDWNFHFTPFDFLEIGLHESYGIAGWMGGPVQGGTYDSAKLGSDGLTLLLKPIQGLRLAASLPFTIDYYSKPDMLNAEDEDHTDHSGAAPVMPGRNDKDANGNPKYATDAAYNEALVAYYKALEAWRTPKAGWPFIATHLVNGKQDGATKVKFQLKLGADYNFKNLFTIGATWNDILDANNTQVGVYGKITAIQNLTIGLGYTFNRQAQGASLGIDFFGLDSVDPMFGLFGQHVAQLWATYYISNFNIGAEAAFNFFQNQSVYDMYAGLNLGYALVPGRVNLGVKAGLAMDFGTQLSWNDSEGNAYNVAGSGTGKKDLVTDPDFAQSFLAGGSDNAWRIKNNGASLYRFANSDWKLANNYKKEVSANEGRGLKGENTDWAGYSAAMVVSVQPSISFTAGNNVFNASAAITYLPTAANDYYVDSTADNISGDWFFKFPVSWTYNFR